MRATFNILYDVVACPLTMSYINVNITRKSENGRGKQFFLGKQLPIKLSYVILKLH